MKRQRTMPGGARSDSKPGGAGKSSQPMRGAASAGSFSGRINPKWAWHYRILGSLRERLLQARRERLVEVAQPLEPHSLNQADSATDEFDHNLALAALSSEHDALHEIDAAFGRIHDGSYGVCEETGQAIPCARLKAVPWTRFARAVEERLERAGEIRPPHLGALSSVRGTPTVGLESITSAGAIATEDRPATGEVSPTHRPAIGRERRSIAGKPDGPT